MILKMNIIQFFISITHPHQQLLCFKIFLKTYDALWPLFKRKLRKFRCTYMLQNKFKRAKIKMQFWILLFVVINNIIYSMTFICIWLLFIFIKNIKLVFYLINSNLSGKSLIIINNDECCWCLWCFMNKHLIIIITYNMDYV